MLVQAMLCYQNYTNYNNNPLLSRFKQYDAANTAQTAMAMLVQAHAMLQNLHKL